jgi:hypothetical protein
LLGGVIQPGPRGALRLLLAGSHEACQQNNQEQKSASFHESFHFSSSGSVTAVCKPFTAASCSGKAAGA